MGMTRVRYEAAGKPVEPIPRESMTLASTQQGVAPSATHLATQTRQPKQISRDGVVVVIPLHHAIQPFSDNGNRFVSAAHQRCTKGNQRRPHSLLRGQAKELEPAPPVRTTTVRESKEVKGFRSV